VSDLSRAILYLLKHTPHLSLDQIVLDLNSQYSDHLVRKRMYSLKYHGSISSSTDKKFSITPKGLEALSALAFDPLPTIKQWDNQWRLVIYDIPETKRLARDRIRELLKSLGFRQLQISVWAHPMPCLKQFKDIQKAYGIERHLLLLEVKDTQEFRELRQAFSRQYHTLKLH